MERQIVASTCRKHPKYKAMRKPRVACEECWRMYIRAMDYLKWESDVTYESAGR